jgi:hypothetical protein
VQPGQFVPELADGGHAELRKIRAGFVRELPFKSPFWQELIFYVMELNLGIAVFFDE